MKQRNQILQLAGATSFIQWYDLVCDGENAYGKKFEEHVRSYTARMLMDFTGNTHMLARPLAIQFLSGLQENHSREQLTTLRNVGDCSLFLLGFFPNMFKKKVFSVGYAFDIGRRSYKIVSKSPVFEQSATRGTFNVYGDLSALFCPLVELLQTIREFDGRFTLETRIAMELFEHTGSRKMLKILNSKNIIHFKPTTRLQ